MTARSIAIAVTCLTFMGVAPAHPQADVVVAEFVGEGSLNTRPFTVDGPWEVQWTASETISVYVYSVPTPGAEPVLEGVALSDPDGGAGASYMPNPGRFYLEVVSFAAWTIAIVEVAP